MTATDLALRERLMRALTLALHGGTGAEESKAAMLGVLRIARSANLNAGSFAAAIGGASSQDADSDDWDDDDEDEDEALSRPFACDITFPFGKHKGKTLAQIARSDFSYLRWIATKFGDDQDSFRSAASQVIEFIRNGGRP